MNAFLQKNHRLLFYSCWIILGLIQSRFTELQDDEAYYWVYGRYLDWGYFDHPPMIGFLVRMGYAIFPNELGVRLFPLLLNVLSLVIIEKLVEKKNPSLFYTIALSIAVLQVSGFVAVPDIPLIFFTALFFLCYQRFSGNYSIFNTFLLGLSVALLLYSKYHAVLIVFFVLLSNIKLFTKYQTYMAGIIALLLFTPHLWWQYQHDWISFRYHLFESNVNAYKPSFTFNYIIGQILLPGPIAGFILLPAAFLYKPKTTTERGLQFTLIGIYAFFLLSSFRGKVEANWTSPVLIPLFILSHQFLNEKITPIAIVGQPFLYKLLPVTLILVLFARIALLVDIVPVKAIRERYHSWKQWPAIMKERTQNLPIVFNNSYQRASKYWFYSGQPTYSFNSYQVRGNNYNFWPIDDIMLGKPVYVLDKYDLGRFPDSLKTPIGWVGYKYDSAFISFARLRIITNKKEIIANEKDSISLRCHFIVPASYTNYIRSHPLLHDTTRIAVFIAKEWVKDFFTPLTLRQMIEANEVVVKIAVDLPKGNYFLRFATNAGNRLPVYNSDKIELKIE